MIKRYVPDKLRGALVLSFVVAEMMSARAVTIRAMIAWDVFWFVLAVWLFRGFIRWVLRQRQMIKKTP